MVLYELLFVVTLHRLNWRRCTVDSDSMIVSIEEFVVEIEAMQEQTQARLYETELLKNQKQTKQQ